MLDHRDGVRQTARLRLEPIAPRHIDDVLRLHADPEVAQWLGPVRDREWFESRLEQSAAAWVDGVDYWMAYVLATGALVGRGGLAAAEVEGEPVHELAWALVRDSWGRGLAVELATAAADLAFDELGLDDVVAFTTPTNVRSRRVMERLGMTYVRDFVRADLPHVLYALSPDTWRARRSGG